FLVALVSIAVTEVVRDLRPGALPSGLALRLAVPGLALVTALAYGAHVERTYSAPITDSEARTVAVVQAQIPTAFRWKRAFFNRTIATYAGLTRGAGDVALDLIVWPENAANFYLSDEPLLASQLGMVAASTSEGLVVGGPRLDDDG